MRPACRPFRPRASGRTLRSVRPLRLRVPRGKKPKGDGKGEKEQRRKDGRRCASRGGGLRVGVVSPALATACTLAVRVAQAAASEYPLPAAS